MLIGIDKSGICSVDDRALVNLITSTSLIVKIFLEEYGCAVDVQCNLNFCLSLLSRSCFSYVLRQNVKPSFGFHTL